jgi:hypothetical protein
MERFKIPGKMFLMGEYSVIDGGKAIVAALNPRFEYSTAEGKLISIHKDSPLGKYLLQTNQKLNLRMSDEGLGAGFGTSTAELIAGMQFVNGVLPQTAAILTWYRKEFPDASGADLAAQLESFHQNHALFEISNHQSVVPIGYTKQLQQILLFQVPPEEKLATHVNLKKARKPVPVEEANLFVDRLRTTLRTGDRAGFAVLTEWANWLSALGLETPFAQSVRSQFIRIPGVIGAKGCGAGLNDVFMVAIEENASAEANLMTVANEFKLRFLGNLGERLC